MNFQVTPLHEVLKYSHGHICKMNPTEAAVFTLRSSERFVRYLGALMKIDITWSKKGPELQQLDNFW